MKRLALIRQKDKRPRQFHAAQRTSNFCNTVGNIMMKITE